MSLRVRKRAPSEEILPQLHEIVNFPVKNDPKRFILVGHGLAAALQVDDAQAPVPQPCIAVDEHPLVVRPPVDEQIPHADHLGFRNLPPSILINNSDNPTHVFLYPGYSPNGTSDITHLNFPLPERSNRSTISISTRTSFPSRIFISRIKCAVSASV